MQPIDIIREEKDLEGNALNDLDIMLPGLFTPEMRLSSIDYC